MGKGVPKVGGEECKPPRQDCLSTVSESVRMYTQWVATGLIATFWPVSRLIFLSFSDEMKC